MIHKLIGMGGIGSHLAPPLCRYLDALKTSEKPRVIMIDGDKYEARNADRQEFPDVGNKAEVTATRMKKSFPDLEIEARPLFVTDENVFVYINTGDIVLLGVDNHATRKLVSDYCQTLENIVLISGGNELTDGNVQIFVCQDGTYLTPPITYLHPEIENPKDRNPAEMSCEELAQSGVVQYLVTNYAASSHMLSAYWMVASFLEKKGDLIYSELNFDIKTGKTNAVLRKWPATTRKKQ